MRTPSTVNASNDAVSCIYGVQEHGGGSAVEEADNACTTEHCEFASDEHAQPGGPACFENADVSQERHGKRALSPDDGINMPECHHTESSTIAVSPDIGGHVSEECVSQVSGIDETLRIPAVADQVPEFRARGNVTATMSTNDGEHLQSSVGRW
jgi:hypothetical protein